MAITGKDKTVDIGVGGRFHSDHLARALRDCGFHVRLWSTLPRHRFPSFAKDCVSSNVIPELVFRSATRMGWEQSGDRWKTESFGRWLAKRVRAESQRDFLFVWSSFGLESLRRRTHAWQVLVRDSAHIRTQMRFLEAEYRRLQLPFPDRTRILERELEEYALADRIVVLSPFARDSFLAEGIAPERLETVSLGVDLTRFTSAPRDFSTRPLRVVYFGHVSVRKGAAQILEAAKAFSPDEVQFTLIGTVEPALRALLRDRPANVTLLRAVTQAELVTHLHRHHVYLLPTVEDGFGQTLIQAMATGLVPIVSDRCGAAADLVCGREGWVIPAGDPAALVAALDSARAADTDLQARHVASIAYARRRSWTEYSRQVGTIVGTFLNASPRKGMH